MAKKTSKKRKVAKKKRAKKPVKTTPKKRKNLADRAKDELKRNPKSQKKRNVRLTPKQILFVDCYLGAAKRTATTAALMAGYKDKSGSQASALMSNPYVSAYLKKRRGDLARRLEVTQEKIVGELAALTFAKPTDFLRWRNGALTVTDSDQIPDDLVGSVKSIEPVVGKKGRVVGLKVRFHDKVAAAKLLAQHLGMLEVKARDGSKGTIVEFMDRIHGEAEGVEDGR